MVILRAKKLFLAIIFLVLNLTCVKRLRAFSSKFVCFIKMLMYQFSLEILMPRDNNFEAD
jgi:hypothetical protein